MSSTKKRSATKAKKTDKAKKTTDKESKEKKPAAKKVKLTFEEVEAKVKSNGLAKLTSEDLKIIIRHQNEKEGKKTLLKGKKEELLERVREMEIFEEEK